MSNGKIDFLLIKKMGKVASFHLECVCLGIGGGGRMERMKEKWNLFIWLGGRERGGRANSLGSTELHHSINRKMQLLPLSPLLLTKSPFYPLT